MDESEQEPETNNDISTPEQPPSREEITLSWQNSPHARSFVVDDASQNNSCAQCHAPTDWQPSMESIPESCFSCKFELDDPPPYIAEQDWNDIPCQVCHEVNKKDEVQPEVAWLEIAAIGEYAEVSSSAELCQKCHSVSELYDSHNSITPGNLHQDQTCVTCHDAHNTAAACTDCHDDLDFTAGEITGHDQDHINIPCAVCHDGSGLTAELNEEAGEWLLIGEFEFGQQVVKTSHNIVLEANCERCHYPDNPWSLSTLP